MDEREKAIRASYGREVFENCVCTPGRPHFDECNAAYLLKLLDETRAERDRLQAGSDIAVQEWSDWRDAADRAEEELEKLRVRQRKDVAAIRKAWAELDRLWRGAPMSTDTEQAKNMLQLRLAEREKDSLGAKGKQ